MLPINRFVTGRACHLRWRGKTVATVHEDLLARASDVVRSTWDCATPLAVLDLPDSLAEEGIRAFVNMCVYRELTPPTVYYLVECFKVMAFLASPDECYEFLDMDLPRHEVRAHFDALLGVARDIRRCPTMWTSVKKVRSPHHDPFVYKDPAAMDLLGTPPYDINVNFKTVPELKQLIKNRRDLGRKFPSKTRLRHHLLDALRQDAADLLDRACGGNFETLKRLYRDAEDSPRGHFVFMFDGSIYEAVHTLLAPRLLDVSCSLIDDVFYGGTHISRRYGFYIRRSAAYSLRERLYELVFRAPPTFETLCGAENFCQS